MIGRGRRAHILIDANPDEPTDMLPNTPDPLAAQLATISLLLAFTVLRLRGKMGGRGGGSIAKVHP